MASAWTSTTLSTLPTCPAKVTTPAAAARTGEPGTVAYSRPRLPAAYGVGGARNGSTTGPAAGAWKDTRARPARGAVAVGAAEAGVVAVSASTTRTRNRRWVRTGDLPEQGAQTGGSARGGTLLVHPPPGREAYGLAGSGSPRRERSCRIALVWIWQTRLSVTPRTSPISFSVRPS